MRYSSAFGVVGVTGASRHHFFNGSLNEGTALVGSTDVFYNRSCRLSVLVAHVIREIIYFILQFFGVAGELGVLEHSSVFVVPSSIFSFSAVLSSILGHLRGG